MNETEKKAFEMLSEEEKDQVSGGAKIDGTTELTDRQCSALKGRIKEKPIFLNINFDPILVQYGGPGMFKLPSIQPPKQEEDQENK